ncbi:MAG: SAM-dependent methyltransferase [Endomicrobium sp.]|uniref:HsdM family class I SAM-dependent methyltransferase n=1 Tax=Candidatus Endomicrobiellum pyrsonymphae TaxID=1408203 RepID=UPI0035852433|nr:SAM-dependent methyltransferase [Endomicrobium sp.]MCA6072833.1 SAM-dependent methyltransferase [Endomicrobium sp.]
MEKNETNTETIFENFISKYADSVALGATQYDWIYERQASKNYKIKKMLVCASKKDGSGKGYPDFIIQSRKNSDFIIVVECKADIKKHESKTGDRYADYAIDGVKLYSSFLAKGFDVLSIAVSGENLKELKASYFLQLKGEQIATTVFDNKLLPLNDLYDGYIKSPAKFRQDYQTLLVFSKTLNDKLHENKIGEDERAFLIGCVLIALEDDNFSKTYATYANAKQLADYLVITVRNAFENDKISGRKLEVLDARFSLIKTNATLSKNLEVLKELITDIKDNIQNFIKTHEYFDVLGQLYIEFLRYANADKGLGIVLTPPHITEFMAEVAEVNKDSVVYDNCTGTGGFLVSAMSIMIKDAKGDKEKEKSIKSSQIIGVEEQAKIFVLACTNMFIHQDGKSNIYYDSCFDQNVTADVKTKNPTVGLLNPPYKSNKKSDKDEYEFILANLDCLQQGGRCVAIAPMSEVLATSGKIYEFKKQVLKLHTLEAVFSMPDELFFNSKVGVVSCIMVFTAKRAHPTNKEVYFGYYKDDGFVKRKTKGRIDLFGKFENEIKNQWIANYRNRKSVQGLSVLKNVTADDEWCAEAYMETDYSNLTIDDFAETIKQFALFKLGLNKDEK